MTTQTMRAIPSLLEAYDFAGIGTLVDIGGGHGVLIAAILAANPDMQGILAPQYGKLVDLLMLGLFASRERTAADWEQLLSAQGFQITQIIPTQAQLSVIETVKC
jgi:hypothetical protein